MKQTMHNTRVRWVLGILIALTLAFIWSNSMQSRAVSGGMSGSLKTWLEQLLHTEISEFLLRKAAHFSEYGLLGVEFSLLLGLQHDKNGKNLQYGRIFRNTAFWVWNFRFSTFRSSACCAPSRMRPFKFSPAAVRLFPMCGSTPPAFRPDSF